VSDAPPRTPPCWFDVATGGDLPQEKAARWTLDNFAGALRSAPSWQLETGAGGPAPIEVCVRLQEAALIIEARMDHRAVEVVLTPGATGWIEVTARLDGREVLRALMDRPYEEYELWPGEADIAPNRSAEAPGRIGKRLNWLSLSASAWPQLAALANPSGFAIASALDS
jgi:hypothetical protein